MGGESMSAAKIFARAARCPNYLLRLGAMRALVQRCSQAAVDVEGTRVAQIKAGMVVLLGVKVCDGEAECDRLGGERVLRLRFLAAPGGRRKEPLGPVREILCVSQFTLYGDTRKGTRPSYMAAARPEDAEPLYDRFCERTGAKKGVFGACRGVPLITAGRVRVMVEVEP